MNVFKDSYGRDLTLFVTGTDRHLGQKRCLTSFISDIDISTKNVLATLCHFRQPQISAL